MNSIRIKYRDFYDVPRIFIIQYRDLQILFDCRFDKEVDDYRDEYQVFVLSTRPAAIPRGSWEHLSERAVLSLGEIPISNVQFDQSKRRSVSTEPIDALLDKNKSAIRALIS